MLKVRFLLSLIKPITHKSEWHLTEAYIYVYKNKLVNFFFSFLNTHKYTLRHIKSIYLFYFFLVECVDVLNHIFLSHSLYISLFRHFCVLTLLRHICLVNQFHYHVYPQIFIIIKINKRKSLSSLTLMLDLC